MLKRYCLAKHEEANVNEEEIVNDGEEENVSAGKHQNFDGCWSGSYASY